MNKEIEEVNQDKGFSAYLAREKAKKDAQKEKPKRKGISKKIRFEVFKRDSFACQYCGKSAPDVVLNVDHIKPVAKGGSNGITNLITSCFDCNAGKSDREISDNSVLTKQKQQLDQLNERRNQIEMMLQWHESIRDMDSIEIDALTNEWNSFIEGYSLNETGKQQLKKILKRNDFKNIVEAMGIAADQYLKYDNNDDLVHESITNAFSKITGILKHKDAPKEQQRIYYIRGILRNRLNYVNERECIKITTEAYKAGATLDNLTGLAKEVKNWSQYSASIQDFLENNNG